MGGAEFLDQALADEVIDLRDPKPSSLGGRIRRADVDVDHLLAEHAAATETVRRYRTALQAISCMGDDNAARIANDALGAA